MQCPICGEAHAACIAPPRTDNEETPKRGYWEATERLYLTEEGEVVGHSDPRKLTLLVPKGGRLPIGQAEALGLTREAIAEAPEPTEKAPKKKGGRRDTGTTKKRG